MLGSSAVNDLHQYVTCFRLNSLYVYHLILVFRMWALGWFIPHQQTKKCVHLMFARYLLAMTISPAKLNGGLRMFNTSLFQQTKMDL